MTKEKPKGCGKNFIAEDGFNYDCGEIYDFIKGDDEE